MSYKTQSIKDQDNAQQYQAAVAAAKVAREMRDHRNYDASRVENGTLIGRLVTEVLVCLYSRCHDYSDKEFARDINYWTGVSPEASDAPAADGDRGDGGAPEATSCACKA